MAEGARTWERYGDEALFRRRLRQALDTREDGFALARVEFDRVDRVAAWFGEAVAEFVQEELAQRLLMMAVDPEALTVGTNSPAFVLLPAASPDADTLTATAWAAMKQLTQPIDIGMTEMSIGCTVGIAHPDALVDRSVAGLIHASTAASHRASLMGSRRVVVFEGSYGPLTREGELVRSLLPALGTGEIAPWFLPQVRLSDGAIVAAEALVRWNHPLFGLVSPGEFMQEAEESGLVRDIDMLVLRQAAAAAATWPDEVSLAVNLSSASLDNPFLASEIADAFEQAGLAARRAIIEVADTRHPGTRADHLRRLATLKELGITLALDDWGTGHAYLDVLGEGLFGELKIDRTLVRGWGDTPNDAILAAVVEFARGLGLEVVAEGIETPEELARVRGAGCLVGQGTLLHPPMPAADFAALLASD